MQLSNDDITVATKEEKDWLDSHSSDSSDIRDNHHITEVTNHGDAFRSYICKCGASYCGASYKTLGNQQDRSEELKKLTHCTFCGNTRQDVKILIARSPMIGICSECVIVCMQIVVDQAHKVFKTKTDIESADIEDNKKG